MTISQTFLIFDNFGSFEDYWSGIFLNIFIEICSIFLHDYWDYRFGGGRPQY